VEAYARRQGYLVFTPKSLKSEGTELVPQLRALAPDILLLASYGKYLSQNVLEVAPIQVNVHPSLLPKHRGPNPILAPILEGDQKTGVTLMRITDEMDAGDIYDQRTFPLDSRITGGELEKQLVQAGLELLENFLKDAKTGKIKTQPQREEEVTATRKTQKEDTEIHWEEPARVIDRKVRAYHPKPRAFFQLRNKKIFVESGEFLSEEKGIGSPQIESLDREEGSVTLRLPGGRYALKKVTPEGKKAMRAYDFVQGYRLKAGDAFQ
jgi:methionyl-tRNA formyltransferase